MIYKVQDKNWAHDIVTSKCVCVCVGGDGCVCVCRGMVVCVCVCRGMVVEERIWRDLIKYS